jgi:hypothetical protein
MSLPFTSKGFVMKSLDLTKALGTGNGHDVLPFLVPFQNFHGYTRKLSGQVPMLKYLQHVANVLYHIGYVKKGGADFSSA